jgi:hypothetical protein
MGTCFLGAFEEFRGEQSSELDAPASRANCTFFEKKTLPMNGTNEPGAAGDRNQCIRKFIETARKEGLTQRRKDAKDLL